MQDSASASSSPELERPPHLESPPSPIQRLLRRVIGGVLFILPLVITGFVIYQVYLLVSNWVIGPLAHLAMWIVARIVPNGFQTEEWQEFWSLVETYAGPPVTLLAVVLFLYLMGYLFQTRINHWIDWLFQHIPGVSTIYQAIRDVSGAMQGPNGLKAIDTVVLVPFPHQDARMAGYLMGESENDAGRKLACVYIPIGVFPPSGYTLIFPREQVTLTDWKAAEVWKMLLSGGLTLPASVPYASASPSTDNADADAADA
ncbi:MAG: DUF502 domain-containing protein [Pirellulaceae bacterium]